MKTPDEIKKGLECSAGMCDGHICSDCPRNVYKLFELCRAKPMKDAIAYIEQLEQRLARVQRERDAATKCIVNVYCTLDKNFPSPDDAVYCTRLAKSSILDYMTGEWRGICAENTKEESH